MRKPRSSAMICRFPRALLTAGQAAPALADRLRQSMALYHRLPRPKAKRAKP